MSHKQSLQLNRAEAIANKIIDVLSPHCKKIEAAGSIRRKRPTVHDIDIVAWPSDRAAIDAILIERCSGIISSGSQITTAALRDGTHLDVFYTMDERTIGDMFEPRVFPPNWGSVLLCRTGSLRHNIYLIEHAKRLGLQWAPVDGVMRGKECIAAESEEEIFKVLQLDFVPPEHRN